MRLKKFFICLFCILMLLILPTNNINAYGEQTDYIEDFEDTGGEIDPLSGQANDLYYGAEWFNTYGLTVEAYVDNTNSYTGSKSYFLGNNGDKCYWNISNSTNVYNFTFYVKRTGAIAGTGLYMEFNNSLGETIIRLRARNDGTGQYLWDYQEYDDDWELIYNDNENGEWCYAGFEISAVDTVKYYWKTYSKSGSSPRTVVSDIENASISQVYLYTATANPEFWFDNITIVPEAIDIEDESNYIIPCDCLTCEEIGAITTSNSFFEPPSSRGYFFMKYDVPVSGNISTIDIVIHDDMATEIYPIEVRLKINNYSLGGANQLVQLGDSAFWRLTWIEDIYIDDEELYLYFRSNADFQALGIGDNLSWKIPYLTYDLDGDGTNWCINYDELTVGYTWWTTFEDSYEYFPDYSYPSVFYDDYSLPVRICIGADAYGVEIHDYNNDLWVNPSTLCANNSVEINYMISQASMLYDKRNITINNVTQYQLSTQSGTYFYTPTTQGTFVVNLSIDDTTVATDSFTVNCWDNNYVYTIPNPSLPNQDVRIYYNYTYATYNARIYIDETEEEWTILPQTSGYKETKFSYSGTYTITLDQYQNGTYINIDKYIHSVSGAVSNKIEISPTNIIFRENLDDREYTTVSGYHNHIGSDVFVLSNGKIIEAVGDEAEFNFNYFPESSGNYVIRLVILKGNEYITLDTAQTLTVGSGTVEEGEDFFTELLGDNKVWLGAMIIVCFLLMPFGLSVSAQTEVPIIIYIAMGTLGTAISVTLQLIDMSYLFAMLVALVSGAVIMYVRGH